MTVGQMGGLARNTAMVEVRFGIVDDKRKVAARVGDNLIIRLHENATTGFQWDILSFSSSAIALRTVERSSPGSEAALGAATEVTFHFTPIGAGETSIVLKLWRGFEPDEVTKKFTLTLEVVALPAL